MILNINLDLGPFTRTHARAHQLSTLLAHIKKKQHCIIDESNKNRYKSRLGLGALCTDLHVRIVRTCVEFGAFRTVLLSALVSVEFLFFI